MRRNLIGLSLGVLLAACSGSAQRGPARWDDPHTQAHLESLLCRLDRECRWIRLRLQDTDQPMAEIRYRFEIVISRGMLERTGDDSERAFLLAHEVAHLRLNHRPPRSANERLPQELAADAWAMALLSRLGMDNRAGTRLLSRLRDELTGPLSASTTSPAALAEYEQRIMAMLAPPHHEGPGPSPASSPKLRHGDRAPPLPSDSG